MMLLKGANKGKGRKDENHKGESHIIKFLLLESGRLDETPGRLSEIKNA